MTLSQWVEFIMVTFRLWKHIQHVRLRKSLYPDRIVPVSLLHFVEMTLNHINRVCPCTYKSVSLLPRRLWSGQ